MLENLKLLRERNHVTQRQLAEAIGVSQQSVNKYENHNIEPDIQTLVQIADYFGTSVDHLIGRSGGGNPVLSDAECELIRQYRMLTPRQRECVSNVIDSYR